MLRTLVTAATRSFYRLHAPAVVGLLLCLSGFQPVADCVNCVNGICQDSAPEADNGTPYTPGTYVMWIGNGSNVSLCYVTVHGRKVILKTCGGKELAVIQIIGYTTTQAKTPSGVPIIYPASSPAVNGYPMAINGPTTGTWPPTTPYRNIGTNCHAEALGVGQGLAGGQDATTHPAPTTPPVVPPGAVPTTGAGFWVEDPAAAYKDPCWHRCTSCGAPPPPHPAGRVVIWYSAPTTGSQTDHSKGTALHSATSNGNGSYTSKNGASENNSAETETNLDNKYGHEGEVKNGRKIHKVVMVKDC